MQSPRTSSAMTLLDALLGVALIALLFVGLVGVYRLSLALVTINKMRVGAIALVNERIEIISGMDYEAVGTVGGIPPGPITPVEYVERNGTRYTIRTLVLYVDDPADGIGAEDHNGIPTDYKQVKVEASWQYRGRTFRYAQTTFIVPPGIESAVGGGTLRIKVVDAAVQPVAGALVRVENETTDPPVATELFSNPEGEVLLGGAPAAAGYRIRVTREGYSTDGTTDPSPSVPEPLKPPLTVEEGRTTLATFAIDRLASLTVLTRRAPTTTAQLDPLSDTSYLSAWQGVQVSEGFLSLLAGEGKGTATSTPVAPQPLDHWVSLAWRSELEPVRVQVWRERSGRWELVPESELPGNRQGFTASPVDLSHLATSTNNQIRIVFTLERGDAGATPRLDWWRVQYRLGAEALGNIPIVATSSKLVGYDAEGNPVPKHTFATTTDAAGVRHITDLEWDSYSVAPRQWRVADVCPSVPIDVPPGSATTLLFYLEEPQRSSVRVWVGDTQGNAVAGATVSLARPGWETQQTTSPCGNTFFNNLAPDTYEVLVRKDGFQPATTTVTVGAEEAETVSITLLASS